MIEVVEEGGWYTWRFISEEGRVVFQSTEWFPTNHAANQAAKVTRASFHRNSRLIDES